MINSKLCAHWGIDEGYEDGFERWHEVSEETKRALLRTLDAEESAEPSEPPLLFITEGAEKLLPMGSEIELEDGTRIGQRVHTRDLPLGYHTLRDLDSGKEKRLIVAPEQCYLREQFRTWGWTLQLYALRSRDSWGIGDLEDLKQVSTWSTDILNAGAIMTNPLGAATPGTPQQPSPYFPSSRLFRNPLYLRIEEVPEAHEALPDLERYAARGRALNELPSVDRDAIYQLKMDALEEIWAAVRDRVSFSSYERVEGSNLHQFAIFCAAAERYGANWRNWPERLQHPDSPQLDNFARESQDRVRFHKWLQWLMDRQFLHASARRNILQDLPIGVDASGADAWLWQDVFAKNVTVGAPPDPFNEAGQNWGLPPFAPHKLRAAGYQPLAHTLRAAMCYSAGLRVDHVMGMFRLFWIPESSSPQYGTYVRYNADEMLSILALESVRAKTFVVGEDLGTVEPGTREKLSQFGVLSYRVLWFEEKPPAQYPKRSLASISTHDLPTIAGLWSGADLEEQRRCGLKINEEGARQTREHLRKIAGVDENEPVDEVIVKAHEALAEAPCVFVLASVEDALRVEQRPNLPGTMDERPNWSIPLPKSLEEIKTDPMVLKIASVLRSGVMKAADHHGSLEHRSDD